MRRKIPVKQQRRIFSIAAELMATQLCKNNTKHNATPDRIAALYRATTPEELWEAYVCEAMKIYNGEDSVIE
jgi:hypothetical protein